LREGIAPAQLSRWKEKLLKCGIAALKQMKTGPKQKIDPELAALQKETERLKEALLETSIELQLIRKKATRGLNGNLRNRHLNKDLITVTHLEISPRAYYR
jgi:hypothetical protein